jgi:hypothetical protein
LNFLDITKHKIHIDIPDEGYTPYPLFIFDISTYQVFSPERRKGAQAEISFRLTKEGFMRVRVVRKENKNIILHNLLTWTKQSFGKHTLQWDIRDSMGTELNPFDFFLIFQTKDEYDFLPHRNHDEESCKDPLIYLNTAVKDRFVKISAAFKKEPFKKFARKGYSVSLYSGIKIIEEKFYKVAPEYFEFLVPILLLNKGQLITININDSYDHIGAASTYF